MAIRGLRSFPVNAIYYPLSVAHLIVLSWPMLDTRTPSFYTELAAQPRPVELETLVSHLTGQLSSPLYQDEHIVAFALPNAKEIAPKPVIELHGE